MQRPPAQRIPILFERSSHDCVARVNQKHKQLVDLELSEQKKKELDQWIETQFVYSTLRLEAVEVNHSLIAVMTSSPDESNDSGESTLARAVLTSLRTVASIAREEGKTSSLNVDILLKLQ